MSHIRIDPITKQAVIIATQRVQKPTDYIYDNTNLKVLSSSEFICPFCRGNENRTPEYSNIIYDNNNNWIVKVVPNKYPIISDTNNEEKIPKYNKLFHTDIAKGFHDVIIESADHHFNFYNAKPKDLEYIFDIVVQRIKELSKEENNLYSLYFKNFGVDAGASLYHSHSQMVTNSFIPIQILNEMNGALDYYNKNDICVYCDIIKEEIKLNERVISQNEEFIAISPFASKSPYQIYILPKNHSASIINSKHSNILFSEIVQDIFNRIKKVLGEISFNYVLHTLPIKLENQYSKSNHWFLDIMPKISKLAGYELGSGTLINYITPEDATKLLKD